MRIGALARNTDLAADAACERTIRCCRAPCSPGASGQLRNKATTAGNLLQRTRCPYFYDPNQPCNKRQPGSGCSAIGGFTRSLAVVGASEACIATHPSDMAVAMRALDATVETVQSGWKRARHSDRRFSPAARRHAACRDRAGAGRTDHSVVLPKPVGGKQVYRKVRDRASYAFALVSVGASSIPTGPAASRLAAWRPSPGATRRRRPNCRAAPKAVDERALRRREAD